tara:strand:- start:90 stop:356 length:267 start_codon:yes stop_codon:yes gene_type:complete
MKYDDLSEKVVKARWKVYIENMVEKFDNQTPEERLQFILNACNSYGNGWFREKDPFPEGGCFSAEYGFTLKDQWCKEVQTEMVKSIKT